MHHQPYRYYRSLVMTWLLDKEWPIDIGVAFTLWSLLFILLSSNVSSHPVSIGSTLAAAVFFGIAGTIYYLVCLGIMAFLRYSGCIVGCAWPVALVFALLYFPVNMLSRLVVVPMLRTFWDVD